MPFKPFSSQKAHTERPPMPPIPTPPPPPPKTPPPAAAAAAYLCLPNDFDRCYQQVRMPGDAEEPNEVRGEPTSVLTTRNHQRSSGLSDSPTHLHTIQRHVESFMGVSSFEQSHRPFSLFIQVSAQISSLWRCLP